MFTDITKYVKYSDLRWSGVLKSIKKSPNLLQPIFEAFTNSLESIRLRQQKGVGFEPFITISLDYNASLTDKGLDLSSITITDNGIGFDELNYKRLVTFKDDTKGFNNRGSGRIQLVHFFERSNYDSVFEEGGKLMHRSFVLSKIRPFIENNTIIYNSTPIEDAVEGAVVETTLKLVTPLKNKDAKDLAKLGLKNIKNALINHYILALCNMKTSLPAIKIEYKVGGILQDHDIIEASDIPDPTRTDISIMVPMCRISEDMKRVENVEESSVAIKVLPYKIDACNLDSSSIKITSKGEISETTKIRLTCLDSNAILDGKRYLFLLSSEYFDNIDGDERGNIEVIDKTEFKKRAKLQGYIEEQIVLNDIQDTVNKKACEIYGEISVKNEEFRTEIEKLKKDYLLSEEALSEVSLSDSIDDVFKKAYSYDAKVMAQQSATYEKSITSLNQLNPASDDYQDKLSGIVDSLVSSIPMQNRATLSKYVARRKMVIELMSKILNRMIDTQEESKRNEDEKLLHNLIFTQKSENPLTSDLWLINEEYMYFKGTSESQLSKVTLDGKKVFREEFSEEETRYLNSLGEKRMSMRTDILLFPAEGKCVIIEFKNPNVNVSDCLNQITKYAYFLRNFSVPEFKFLTFYGYLIGESVEKRDVRAADGDFVTAPNLDYLFRPKKIIPDDNGTQEDGTLYMEVLKFSVLKERAELRNKAFIDRLIGDSIEKTEGPVEGDVDENE